MDLAADHVKHASGCARHNVYAVFKLAHVVLNALASDACVRLHLVCVCVCVCVCMKVCAYVMYVYLYVYVNVCIQKKTYHILHRHPDRTFNLHLNSSYT